MIMEMLDIILRHYVKALESCENVEIPTKLQYCKMRTYHDIISYISSNYQYILFESKYRKREFSVIKKMFQEK